jgi:diguanylate cyclase (GGDEF)-like protein
VGEQATMMDKWLILSYSSSIITNVVVFFGVLSLIYWIGEKKEGRVKQWHDQIQMGICWLFVLYLFGMSAVDGHFAPVFFGSHWTYLNMLIIASFMFCLLMVSWVHFGVSALATLAYSFYMPGAMTSERLGCVAFAIMIQAILTAYGRQIWSNRFVLYPFMTVYGASALLNMGLGAHPEDGWFWGRQVVALALQFILIYEYSTMMVRIRRASDLYRTEAIRDRMTGMKNFGTFNKELERLYHRHQAGGPSFWLMELDVDHFKAINDTYGHLVGNTVLTTVAHETRAYSDTLDYETMVYRMGGEEFCLLIQGGTNDLDKAHAIGEGLRKRLAALNFYSEEGQLFHITVSLGAEHADRADKHYLDIYNRVDKRLYAAKQGGRNMVAVGQ